MESIIKWLESTYRFFENNLMIKKGYIWFTTFISSVLAYYTDLHIALYFFIGATILDTITAIDAQAKAEGMVFRPWKKYFWLQIKSRGLRDWCEKIFWKYGRWLIMAFMLNEWVLKNMVIFDMFNRKLTLPVVAVYLFGFIECWSIGENIEKTGDRNIIKMIFHFLPEKFQKIFKKVENETN